MTLRPFRGPAIPDRTGCQPCFDIFEPRLLLAGNVLATVNGLGDLILTGDAADNSIVVDQVGLSANQLRITSGADATTINGLAGPVVLTGVAGEFSFDAAAGSDTLLFSGKLAKGFLFTGGTGDNMLDLQTAKAAGDAGADVADYLTTLSSFATPPTLSGWETIV